MYSIQSCIHDEKFGHMDSPNQWTGTVEWNGGMDWTGLDWTGLDWTGLEWNGMEWNGMERPDKLGGCEHVQPLPLKFGCSRPLRRDYRLLNLFTKSKDLCLQTH